MFRVIATIFVLLSLVSVQVRAQILFDDPNDPFFEIGERVSLPDTVVAKFIFISFPDLADTILDPEFVHTIPDEFKNFFVDQSRGNLTIECSTITVPGDSTFQWVATHNYAAYRDSLVNDFAEYCRSPRAEVTAETIFRIKDAYGSSNPLLDCDYIFIVHQRTLLATGVAGSATTYLKSGAIPDSVSSTTSGFTAFQNWSGGEPLGKNSLRTIFQHEYGHLLGFSHLPDDPTMTYGMYAPMRPTLIKNCGFIPFHGRTLERSQWVDPAEVITDKQMEIELHDAHSHSGKGLRIGLEAMGGLHATEEFFLSFFNGESYSNSYPSRGLAVWHNQGTWPSEMSFLDLEQAAGRWENPANQIGPSPISGIDLMDVPGNAQNSYYVGDETDFFPVATDSVTEFSYRTNPSTWGGRGPGRLSDQDVPLSLVVLARGETDSTILVDVLPAPFEKILSPTSDLTIEADSSMTVTWEDYFYEQPSSPHAILTEVQLWFSVDGGATYDPAITGDYDSFSLTWSPTPRDRWATSNGRLKLVFLNTLTDLVGTTESPITVSIDGNQVPWESVLEPSQGTEMFTTETFPVTWSNRHGETITRVDLAFSTDSGLNWSTWRNDISYSAQGDSVNVAMWQPDDDAASDQFRIKLRFHSSSGQGEDISNGDAIVFPVRARFFDVTVDQGVLPTFDGQPAAIVPIEADGDTNGVDLLMSIGSANRPTEGKLFINNSAQGGALGFEDHTNFYLPSQLLEVGFGAMAVADYDNDGDDDFFACRPDDEVSQLFIQASGEFSSINPVAFAVVDSTLLQYARCAAWVDFDHDGDLDLYVGRGESNVAKRDLLLEFDPEANAFSEIGLASGLVDGVNPIETSSVVWADLGQDGLWDVIKAGPASLEVYRQVTADSFAVDTSAFPGSMPQDNVFGLRLADFDRDNDLDLLVIRAVRTGGGPGGAAFDVATSYICYNSDGSFEAALSLPELNQVATEGHPLDYDLDGWVDVLIPNMNSTDQPALLVNLKEVMEDLDNSFKNLGQKVGLQTGQLVRGALATDLNRDGDLDLFLGQVNRSTGTLYMNTNTDSTQVPAAHWLGIRLTSPNRSQSLSTTVALETVGGDPLGSAAIDGGGAATSQQPRQLTFGLGEHTGDVTARVYWPDGRVQTESIAAADLDKVVTITEDEAFTLDTGSVGYELEFNPYTEKVTWVFKWETDNWTEPAKDTVYLTHISGSNCESMPVTINGSDLDVWGFLTFQRDPQTGAISYLHELRWLDRDCHVGCQYNYKVESGFGNEVEWRDPTGKNSNVAFPAYCPTSD